MPNSIPVKDGMDRGWRSGVIGRSIRNILQNGHNILLQRIDIT